MALVAFVIASGHYTGAKNSQRLSVSPLWWLCRRYLLEQSPGRDENDHGQHRRGRSSVRSRVYMIAGTTNYSQRMHLDR